MSPQHARARLRRLREWILPPLELDVPVVRAPEPGGGRERLLALCGHRVGDQLVLLSPSGLEIPVPAGCSWSVLAVSRLLQEIDGLPVLAPGSRRT